MPAAFDCDVLIVGGGPTGVTLGLLLARRGVETIVIDKEPDIYPLPRAAHIDHEIVRIFQELGLAEAVMATSRTARRYDFLTANREVLLRFDGSDRIGPGGWPGANMIHQPSIEAILRGAARDEPKLSIRTAHAWTSSVERDGGIDSTIATPNGDIGIRARFLLGCDGARSPVRAAADIGFEDLHFDEQWLVIDVLVQDASRLPADNLQICDPARPTTCVLMGSGRHRWEFMLRPGETAEQMLDDVFIQDLLKPWNVEGAVAIERKAVYRFNAKLATHWRAGRTLLAGDAAHLMPPFAGQGLCSGLRDAANLAWKLSAVLNGADASLLDSYQSERAPHVRGIIDLAIMMGRTVCITDPQAAQARDEAMLSARRAGAQPAGPSAAKLAAGCLRDDDPAAGLYFPQPIAEGARFDDAIGARACLICADRGDSRAAPDLNVVALSAPELAPFKPALERWLAAQDAAAVLVRPDRYVFGAGAAQDLAAAWRAMTR